MNKKLTIISLVFLSLLLVLSGCKKDEEKEVKTEGAKYTQGVIKELYDNTFLMSSTDSRYSGDIVVPTRNEAGVTLNFEPGDEVKVYYSGKFFETDPAQVSKVISFTILKKASEAAIPAKETSEKDQNKEEKSNKKKPKDNQNESSQDENNQDENIDDSVSAGDEMDLEANSIDSNQNEESSQENSETNENSESETNQKPKKKKSSETSESPSYENSIVYYNMPELSVKGPKSTRKMSKNEYALVYDLIDNIDNWEKDEKGKNINPDFIIKDGNNTIAEFNSKTKMLKDTRNDIYIKLHKDLSKVLLEALTGNL